MRNELRVWKYLSSVNVSAAAFLVCSGPNLVPRIISEQSVRVKIDVENRQVPGTEVALDLRIKLLRGRDK